MSEPDGLQSGIVSGRRVLTMATLFERARCAARGLRCLGVGEGDAVALVMRNDIPFFEAARAAMLLGAYPVPVNWHFVADEAAYVIHDCGAKAVVIHADLHAGLRPAMPPEAALFLVPTPPEIAAAYGLDAARCSPPAGATLWSDWLEGFAPWDAEPRPFRSSMIYTSGTTGRPKGVRREPPASPQKAEQMARIRSQVFGVRPGGRILMTGPVYHSAPALFATAGMLNDNLIVLQPRFDAEQCLALIERYRISGVHLVPTMFVRLLKLPAAVRGRYDLSSLEHVVHGAARCPADVKRAIIDWLGPIVHEYYGGTESGPVVASTSEEFLARPGTVGRAVEGGVIKILDAAGRALPAGETGEIYMWLDAYPDFTYQGDDAKRREIEVDGLITLGDVGHMDADGYLYISDRLKDMVISGGVNIYPAEIEAVLIGMPGVRDCAVFGIPDQEFGEALAAAVEPEPGARLTAQAVIAWLAEHQAGYKRPRIVTFHEALPREDSGKIFKRRLREPYWRDAGRRI